MHHFPNHHERVSDILEQFGVEGYGAFWLLNEVILSNPDRSMSFRSIVLELPQIERRLIERILNDFNHFYEIDGKWYSSVDSSSNISADTAYIEFAKPRLSGRVFTRMVKLHGVSESRIIEEFEKWKKYNKHTIFNDHKHMLNSFNFWLTKADFKKQTQTIDWDKV